MSERVYYYGEGTDHEIRLTPAQADAVNKLRIREVPGSNPRLFETNLNDEEVQHYHVAARKLNEYLETHDVFASDEFLKDNEILRLKE